MRGKLDREERGRGIDVTRRKKSVSLCIYMEGVWRELDDRERE